MSWIVVFEVITLGIGATLLMDIASWLLNQVGYKTLDYGLAGRLVGHFFLGQFRHDAITQSHPIAAERLIGWIFHYLTGIAFGGCLIILTGAKWLHDPSLKTPLLFGAITVAVPFFIMQPAMGFGVAAQHTPNPFKSRCISFVLHSTFGLGLYFSAQIVNIAQNKMSTIF